jgi:outer membrane immunogenic protein
VYAFLRSILFVFSLLGAFTSATSAQAGNIFDDSSPGVSIDWSGLYAGLHGGYGWSRQATGLGQDIDIDGWLAGGHLGLQRQFDRWVLGIEASYTGGDLDGSTTIGSGALAVNIATSVSDLLMITGRLGYAWHDRLFYVKGGYASADVDFTITTPGGMYSSNSRLDGWTAGIGFERMITRNVSFGLEYNYIDLGGTNLSFSGGGGPVTFAAVVDSYCPPPKPISGHLDPDSIHTIMARLSFKFGDEPEHVPYK